MTRRVYFSFSSEIAEFDNSLTKLIADLSRLERNKFIHHDNTMRYSHGTKWVSVSSSNSEEETKMVTHQTETIISMQDIREHNLQSIHSFINDITGKMTESFQRNMYQTISSACSNSGNTINAKEYESSADAMLASLRMIEFGVDKNGEVSLPEIHVGPGAIEKFKKDAEAKGPEFENEVEKVIEEKTKVALEREKLRKARYRNQ